MSWLLKIVQGPNAGAEIALLDGVAVSLGKSDACDIILADPSLPEEPLAIESGVAGVVAGGEPLEAFHVKTVGSTSFAVGPAEGAWGGLVWPAPAKDAEGEAADGKAGEAAEAAEAQSGAGEREPSAQAPAGGEGKKRRRSAGCGCLAVLLLLLLVAAAACWFFRDTVVPCVERGWGKARDCWSAVSGRPSGGAEEEPSAAERLAALAERYNIAASTNSAGALTLAGDFKTRRDRLEATAAAYSVLPGVSLDFADDESMRSAVEDTLFTIGGNALKVAAATNRVVALSGAAPSAGALRRILEAMNADLPKLRGVDCAAVRLGGPGSDGKAPDAAAAEQPAAAVPPPAVVKTRTAPQLPVCGILATPYPCLVMRNGARILEGATIGGSTILKIEPDAVTITNSTGRFVWKP